MADIHLLALRYLQPGFTTVLMFLAGISLASAQQKPFAEDPLLATIRKEVMAAYAPLEAALRSDKAFADRLSGELKAASTEKDPARRKAALAGYASKYAADYGKYAAKAGLRTEQILALLSARYKDYAFQAANTYGILFRKKKVKPPPKAVKPAPAPVTRTVPLTVNPSQDGNCLGVAGVSTELQGRGVTISNWAAVAGGCGISAHLKHRSELPDNVRSLRFRLAYTARVEGSAVGALGVSTAFASVYMMSEAGGEYLFDPFRPVLDMDLVAPFLWVAFFEDDAEFDEEYHLTDRRGERIEIWGTARVLSSSVVCCGTGATARLRLREADLIVTE